MDPSKVATVSNIPNFTLSARQEQLLFAALNSNNKPDSINISDLQSNNQSTMAPGALTESPLQQAPGSGTMNGFEDSPFIDYDYEFDADGSYDYNFSNDSQGQMIGKLPGTSSDGDGDLHDKRGHEDDEDDEEGGGKRREGDEKSSKKPGRKPLTSEPTSKRKAQNRAAQRAFRERKEKHLKDLETKVEDLEKASESANHENSILRAQIEKMSTELREYRKRVSLAGPGVRSSSSNNNIPPYLAGKGLGNGSLNNPNDVNFQFEFPRFGRLPGPPQPTMTALSSPTDSNKSSASPVDRGISPRNQSMNYVANNISGTTLTQTPGHLDDMSSLSGLFSPSILEGASKSNYDFFGANGTSNGSRSSTDSNRMSTGHNTSYSSPSASSNGNQGPSSSCGTSPEPSMQSPGYSKTTDVTLTTIGEEKPCGESSEGELTFCDKLNMACGNPNQPIPRTLSDPGVKPVNLQDPTFDVNGIDWFAQQNGNQFDPQLFGDYREPQENILSNDAFNNDFFNDAFPMSDFNSPFNIAPSPISSKKEHVDLVSQIDQIQNEDEEVVPAEDRSQLLNCNTIWDRLQACPKVKDGEFDLDSLCKDLQKKAKCSETGAVVNEADFKKIMKTYTDNSEAQRNQL